MRLFKLILFTHEEYLATRNSHGHANLEQDSFDLVDRVPARWREQVHADRTAARDVA